MRNLWGYEYQSKRVKILGKSGKTTIGFVDVYTHELDAPDGIPYIAVREDGSSGYLIEFTAADISTIEIVETTETAPSPQQSTQQLKELQPA
ncbi:MAG: hypothetical protein FWG68_05120 [Defluviitaleaceae bacterium]|nr:hypothetical protein [Defluviitaleaceae bacterium]